MPGQSGAEPTRGFVVRGNALESRRMARSAADGVGVGVGGQNRTALVFI
jgi:hypothetical protein